MKAIQVSISGWVFKVTMVFIENRILLLYYLIDTMPFVATQMKLEGMALSDISQARKDKYGIISFYVVSQTIKLIKIITEL